MFGPRDRFRLALFEKLLVYKKLILHDSVYFQPEKSIPFVPVNCFVYAVVYSRSSSSVLYNLTMFLLEVSIPVVWWLLCLLLAGMASDWMAMVMAMRDEPPPSPQ